MDCFLDSEQIFQVASKYFSNNRDITKCQSFLHDAYSKAIAIRWAKKSMIQRTKLKKRQGFVLSFEVHTLLTC